MATGEKRPRGRPRKYSEPSESVSFRVPRSLAGKMRRSGHLRRQCEAQLIRVLKRHP